MDRGSELASLLRTNPGACTLEIQRVVYADIGRALEVSFIAAAGMLWELAYILQQAGESVLLIGPGYDIHRRDWLWR
jgi:predicted rRNA methylase YqxC with S4 and FtsJ domains